MWLWDVKRADSALYILFNQRIYNFIRAGFDFQVEINQFYYWKLLETHITAKHPRVFCLSGKKENKKKKNLKERSNSRSKNPAIFIGKSSFYF